jgi:carbamoyltransferase
MRVLGVSAFYHDSAAALIDDGLIVAAAQEERFTRKKHDANFPKNAIDFVLAKGGLKLEDVDAVAFYDKPFLKFERLLETYLAFAPKGFSSFRMAMPLWLREKLFQKDLLKDEFQKFSKTFDWKNKLLFSEHHLSHAASAYFPSPFDEAVVLTMDGVGEWATTSVCIGKGKKLEVVRELHFPHSIGLLYSAFTYYTGFKVNSGEYKVMGLAPYGEPKYKDLILEKLLDLREDGTFNLDQSYFDYCTGLRMTNDKFAELFGGPARRPDKEPLLQRHMDLATSIQAATEEIVLRLTRSLSKEFGVDNLCLAGGVALNCVANGKILREKSFKNLWIQPAAGDAGGALGAALSAYHMYLGKDRAALPAHAPDRMQGSYLGDEFSQTDIEARLTKAGAKFEALSEDAMIAETAKAMASDQSIGWFQGRMEFGPRSLGARSIIADGRSPKMQSALNLKIKYRESFRPFAPAVLREDVAEWFELDGDSPYMLLVADVAKKRCFPMTSEQEKLFGIQKLNIPRSEIPAVTHVDYSARVQTVHESTNPIFTKLLRAFKAITGCPVVVNTSFNVRGEPIVHTPEDAFRCFMGTEMDVLAIGNCILRKAAQDPALKLDYKNAFELD